jgi:hypothetical protein
MHLGGIMKTRQKPERSFLMMDAPLIGLMKYGCREHLLVDITGVNGLTNFLHVKEVGGGHFIK